MPDLENIDIAVGIALLASLRAMINAFHGCRSPSWISTSSFIPVLSYGIDTRLFGMVDPKT